MDAERSNSNGSVSLHYKKETREYIPTREEKTLEGLYTHKLQLLKYEEPKEVDLRYPYLRIPSAQKVQFVGQGAYYLLTPASSEDIMIVGTLKPCIALVLYNPENSYTLGIHFHWTNRVKDIKKLFSLLSSEAPQQLQAYIYSKELEKPEKYKNCFQFAYGNRSHKEQLIFLSDYLEEQCGFNKNNISVTLCKRKPLGYLGEYFLADACLAFRKSEGLAYVTCPLHEDIFNLSRLKIRPVNMASTWSAKKEIILLLKQDAFKPWEYSKTWWLWRFNVIMDGPIQILEKDTLFFGLQIQSEKDLPWEEEGKFKGEPNRVPFVRQIPFEKYKTLTADQIKL